jgi:SsrA-binding protein
MKSFKNRKAYHNYFFLQDFEAGIVLQGTEVKSIRSGKLNFKDSFARIEENEIWLHHMHISVYERGSYSNHDPERKRKLLLNRREIKKIMKYTEEKGMTLVPKTVFINDKGLVKVVVSIAKGKKTYDKRDSLKEKDAIRDVQRKIKNL